MVFNHFLGGVIKLEYSFIKKKKKYAEIKHKEDQYYWVRLELKSSLDDKKKQYDIVI